MSKKSISHDEALRQAYAEDPMQAVVDMHELARQANDLEDENRVLRERVQELERMVAVARKLNVTKAVRIRELEGIIAQCWQGSRLS